jgi:uncharacterized protein with PQ loop repeat
VPSLFKFFNITKNIGLEGIKYISSNVLNVSYIPTRPSPNGSKAHKGSLDLISVNMDEISNPNSWLLSLLFVIAKILFLLKNMNTPLIKLIDIRSRFKLISVFVKIKYKYNEEVVINI